MTGTGIGTDKISGVEVINLGTGDDTFINGSSDDTINAGGGVDVADYTGETNTITANLTSGAVTGTGIGTDDLSGFEVFKAGSSDDVITGSANADTIFGNNGADTLIGTAGGDTLDGGAGMDRFIAHNATGNDTFIGDAGVDTADYSSDADDLVVDFSGTDSVTGTGIGTDRLNGVEVVNLGSGDDTFINGGGDDTINAGGGVDVADYRGETNAITANLTSGAVTGTGIGTDDLSGFEVFKAGSGDDVITGSANADTISGGDGADTLIGTAGGDIFNAGVGDDRFIGHSGTGNDTFAGFIGVDTADYSADSDDLVVDFSGTNSVTGTGIGTDILNAVEVVKTGSGDDELTGSTGNDTFFGGAGADTFHGTGGADILNGEAGADVFNGADAAGNDTFLGGGAVDTADYSSDADNLTVDFSGTDSVIGTGIGTDKLDGVEVVNLGTGDDTFINGASNDTISAGAGKDVADYDAETADMTYNLATGAVTGAGTDELSGFEVYLSGSGDDRFIVHDVAANNTLNGGTGTDTADYSSDANDLTVDLSGTDSVTGTGIGADILNSVEVVNLGTGDDTFINGASNDTISAGAGQDVADYSGATSAITANLASGGVTGTGIGTDDLSGFEVFKAGSNDDIIDGSTNADTIFGNDGNDAIFGDAGNDTLNGGSGNDLLRGSGGNDVLNGGIGDDTLKGGIGDDTLNGGSGIDTAGYGSVGVSITVDLSGGTDSLTGAVIGTDILNSIEVVNLGSGNDTFINGASDDTISAGAGQDVADYDAETADMTYNLATGAVAGAGTDVLSGFEVYLSGSGDDTFIAHDAAANNTLNGGTGTDTADYSSDGDDLTVDLSGTGTVSGSGIGTDTLNSVEVIKTGAGDDEFTGSTGNDTFSGGGGADTFHGTNGADIMNGEGGADVFIGADVAGDDTFNGGAGMDTADYSAESDDLMINFLGATPTVSGTGIGTDVLNSVEVIKAGSGNDQLFGSVGDDVLFGGAGNDLFFDSIGDDTVYGGAGNDSLRGGVGNDTYDGGADTDILDYSTTGGNVTSGSITGGSGTITYSNGDVDTISGGIEGYLFNTGDDTISFDTASFGNLNTLDGGGGNDTIGISGDLTASGGIDGSTIADVFTNVEELDFTSGDINSGDTFDLDLTDLQSITGLSDGSGALTIHIDDSNITFSEFNITYDGTFDDSTSGQETYTWSSGESLTVIDSA